MSLKSPPIAEISTQSFKKPSIAVDSPVNTVNKKINNNALDILGEDLKTRQASTERIAERLLQIDQGLPLPK